MDYTVEITQGIALVTLESSNGKFSPLLLQRLSEAHILVDMIASTPPSGPVAVFSFTISDDDTFGTLRIIKEIQDKMPGIACRVSGRNSKIKISGEKMLVEAGIAARIFDAIWSTGADLNLVTTSDCDISLLVPESDEHIVYDAILPIL